MKKLFIRTFGCQMNVYDSQRMADLLAPAGYESCATAEEADLIILNTCHIREKAAEKVYSELGRIRSFKAAKEAAGERLVVGVAGCVAQAEGEEIMSRAPVVDLVVGPQAYHCLPELVEEAHNAPGPTHLMDIEFPVEEKFDALIPPTDEISRARGASAFLTIQEGCDKFCTFCVVPYTRGAEYSRPVSGINDEAQRLVRAGVRQITLLGQNVNAYHGEGTDGHDCSLADLVQILARIPELERLRYTTSHPRNMTSDLIAAHRDVPQLMPYLHLPVQSGSDAILTAMNRQHTAEDYIRLTEKIRASRPDIALSSDFIVGFPGESDADFEATLALIKTVNYAQAFSFKYSARPGTPAAESGKQVPESVKEERLQRLQALLRKQQLAFNEACVGKCMPVLFEAKGRHERQFVGRSPYLQPVHATSDKNLAGEIHDVIIETVHANSLQGTLMEPGMASGSQQTRRKPLAPQMDRESV